MLKNTAKTNDEQSPNGMLFMLGFTRTEQLVSIIIKVFILNSE